MKKICVVTATRAEYGLLKNVIKEIHNDDELELVLAVTGMHLSQEFGLTVNEIEKDGFPISEKIEILMNSDTPQSISKTMGIAMISFADFFSRNDIDALIVLGDRYELLAICSCAMNEMIPIIHISGGETTEGAIDESIRHCLTKMSYLHFPSCEDYKRRIIQLGEYPDRVFNYGDVGVENILKSDLLSKNELEESINFKLDCPYASITFHPVTLEISDVERQCDELFEALETFSNMKFVFTKANSDAGGRVINHKIDVFVEKHRDKCVAFASLGAKRYLSLLKYCEVVIGNSSSGIIEAPCFKKPTVNIGKRQAGRIKAESIIDCDANKDEIIAAVNKAMSKSFKKTVVNSINPFSGYDTAKKIVNTTKAFLYNDKIDLRKKFYDLPKECLNNENNRDNTSKKRL